MSKGADVKGEILKNVEALKDPSLGQKERLDLLNKLVELSEKIEFKSSSELLPISDFLRM